MCDKFRLSRSDQSLCPLCLCGSFQLIASRNVSYNTFYPPNPRYPPYQGGIKGGSAPPLSRGD
ncbi:MAG: hypothetical protein DWQ54_20855 [Microcystis flos-aquae TF09]|uniref:Uncharacterized protein n=1 Tax=Microcystis flos-aquae TF09 TaxID=2060473 RepID=A0A3E0KWZ5_9CHRO|nr:MAG: hypothetical protein DWQ54_20855 [Microcystis flos-aquae TF09]